MLAKVAVEGVRVWARVEWAVRYEAMRARVVARMEVVGGMGWRG